MPADATLSPVCLDDIFQLWRKAALAEERLIAATDARQPRLAEGWKSKVDEYRALALRLEERGFAKGVQLTINRPKEPLV